MERRSNKYANQRSSKKTKNLFDTEEEYLKAVSVASQILSLGTGMVGIPVPFYHTNLQSFYKFQV